MLRGVGKRLSAVALIVRFLIYYAGGGGGKEFEFGAVSWRALFVNRVALDKCRMVASGTFAVVMQCFVTPRLWVRRHTNGIRIFLFREYRHKLR